MRRVWGCGLLACLAFMTPALVAAPASAREADQQIRRVFVAGEGGGYLGVNLGEVDAQAVERLRLSEERGAVVLRVEKDGAADKAGLAIDDVIVRYQGEPVESAVQLARRVRETPPGRKVSLEVMRKGALQKLSATLGKRKDAVFGPGGFNFEMPEMNGEAPHFQMHPGMPPMPPHMPDMGNWPRPHFGGPRKLGLEFQPISGQLAKYFKLDADQGLLVASVDDDGPAAKAGLKAGDVLLKLNGQDLRTGADLRDALDDVEPGQEIAVSVWRDGKPLEVKLTAGGAQPDMFAPAPKAGKDPKKDARKPKSI